MGADGLGSFVEVAEHDHVLTGADSPADDPPDFRGLAFALVSAAARLALEAIDQDEHRRALRRLYLELRAIAGEDHAVGVLGVDVGPDRADRESLFGHDAD